MSRIPALACGVLAFAALLPAQAAWTQLAPATSPAARAGTVGCSDGAGVLMWGGNLGSNVFSDELWRFDGASWTNLTGAGTKPSPRDFYAAAYDSTRGRLVVFGGRSSAGIEGDTWEWDGVNWTQLAPATSPSPRRWAAMAYDPRIGACVLFGGETANASTYVNETWAWDGTNWTLLTPATSPSIRGRGFFSYDPIRGEMLHFGGRNAAGALGETWIWNGSDWRQVVTATVPYTRGCFAYGVAYDMVRDRHVLFGGTTTGPTLAGTWEFDGTDWQSRTSAATPSSRTGSCLAFVPAMGRVYLFGGYQTAMLGDTWEFATSAVAGYGGSGAGCAGSVGVPSLACSGLPWVGEDLVLNVFGTAPTAMPFVVLGFAPTSIPLAVIGFPGCVVQADPMVALPALPAGGVPTLSLAIPNDPNLIGLGMYAQAIVLEPGSATPVSVSARGDLTFGAK